MKFRPQPDLSATRVRVSWLMVLMIVLQSLTAIVEVHAVELAAEYQAAHDALHLAPQGVEHAGDSAENSGEDSLDHVLHCPHHGCHCPLYVSGGAPRQPLAIAGPRIGNYSRTAPDAPVSLLFRPPIA